VQKSDAMFLPTLALIVTLNVTPPPVTSADTRALCVPSVQLAQPEACPAYGPGDYWAHYATARVPAPLPDLPLASLPVPDPIIEFNYARVTTPDAPLFTTPADGVAGHVARTLGKGFIFVNMLESAEEGGQAFYKIRAGEYIRASDVQAVTPSSFQGLKFTTPPTYPVGWLVATVRPSYRPGEAAPTTGPRLGRYRVVQIFATQKVGDWNWYLVGPNQWLNQRVVSVLTLNAPPSGVTGKWVQVDLYEQTLVAYEDTTPVYATLISSGLDKWATRPGLFQVYARYYLDGMRGSYEPDGSDYYSLESVPWVMYFDGARALHGEYWHNGLGFKRSHGCVNLAPLDARWLYDWTPKGTWVWVYDPSGQTPVDGEAGGAP
jgi:hypothetical protein